MNLFLQASLITIFGSALAMMPAVAQQDTGPAGAKASSAGSQSMNSMDKTFVKKAASGGLAEVQLGQLAQEKATNPKVKEFGERMVTDHSKANDQLKQLAAQQNIDLPQQLNSKDQAILNKLQKLSGEQFDKAYMQDMVRDHKADVAEFESESKSAKDPALKNFATETLPTLKEHLRMAEQIAPMQKGSGTTSGSGQ